MISQFELWYASEFEMPALDLENAYNRYLTKLMGSCPGFELLPQAKIRPDLGDTKFISSTVAGK